jgi:ribonuclease P/MRP protein subunit POP1
VFLERFLKPVATHKAKVQAQKGIYVMRFLFLQLTPKSRFSVGSRALETHIHKPGSYPFDLIAPITVIWKPLAPISPLAGTKPDSDTSRVVWLRSHPSVFDEVFSSVQAAASLTLDATKRNMGEEQRDIDVEIADLRGHINVFEIMGPKSSQVLKGALNPVPQDQRKDFTQVIPGTLPLSYRINMPTILVLEKPNKPADSRFDTAWHNNRIYCN